MIPLPIIHVEPPPTAEQIRKGKIADAARARAAARRDDNRAFGELLHFKFRVIKARMEAHGMEIESYLGPTLLALSPVAQWLGLPNEAAILHHYAYRVPQPFIAAARENPDVAAQTADAELVKFPPVVLRFEHASVIAGIGDAMAASANKSWGQCLSVDPIDRNMPWDDYNRMLYIYHRSSKYNRRIEQRKYMKRKLGKLRSLVGHAMSGTKKDWLDSKHATDANAEAIRVTFNIDLGDFWRAVKGTLFLEDRPPHVRGELF